MIGADPVGDIIGVICQQPAFYKDRLVTESHFPFQIFQGKSGIEFPASLINTYGISVDNLSPRGYRKDLFQCVRGGQKIAGIQEKEPLSQGHTYSFVHGVIDALVRL